MPETSAAGLAAPRRVLVVSYYYGPGSATGGFRWHALAHGLAALGWEIDVITADTTATEGNTDRLRAIVVPPVTSQSIVRRMLDARGGGAAPAPGQPPTPPVAASAAEKATPATAAGSPVASTGGPLRWLRSIVGRTLHGVDSLATEFRWVHNALAVARGAAAERRYAAVIVSAPPMGSLLVGRTLAREHGIPFIADYRDPWYLGAGPLRLKSDPVSWAAAAVLDRHVQRGARAIIHNTDRARRAVDAEFPLPRTERLVVINGYDGALPDVRPDPGCFRIVYGGWIHPYMDPQPLLAALGRLRARVQPAPGTFELEFLGSPREVGGVPMAELTARAGLDGCVVQTDRLPRPEAVARQQRAAVLAALDYPHGNAVVMKFYDYAQMFGTMLLVGRPDSALAEASARIGVPVVAPDDAAGLDARLDAAWQRWRAQDWSRVNDADGVFDRRHSITRMDELLTAVIHGGRR